VAVLAADGLQMRRRESRRVELIHFIMCLILLVLLAAGCLFLLLAD
jgi:hypothetical protein